MTVKKNDAVNPEVAETAKEDDAVNPEVAETAKEEEERVLIMVPYIEGEDPEVTVGINGVFTKIQKGKQVRVTKAVAEVLQHSNEQAMITLENRQKFKTQVTDM